MICSKCGYEHQGNFCPKCGTPGKESVELPKNVRFCTNCGKPIKEGTHLCLHCGVKNNTTHNYCYYCGNYLAGEVSVCGRCRERVRGHIFVRVLAILSLCIAPLWMLVVLLNTENIVYGLMVLLSIAIMLFVAMPAGQNVIRKFSHEKRWLRFPLYLGCFVLAAILSVVPFSLDTFEAPEKNETALWVTKYNVEDLDAPNDGWYITNNHDITGTFSNYSTTNSKLRVKLYVNEDVFAIRLLTYGRYEVKNSLAEDETYEITVKWEDGTESTFYGTMPSGGNKIILQASEARYITRKLRKDSEMEFTITKTSGETASYTFVVHSEDFDDVYFRTTKPDYP